MSETNFLQQEVDAGLLGDRKEPLYKILLRWTGWLLCTVLLCACVRFFFQEAIVSGDSMNPTLCDGERYMTLRQFDESDIDYGTIVCFASESTHGQSYIKRVVGLPGDKVVIHDGVLYVNNIETDYTYDEILSGGIINEVYYTLGDNEYFVMGDNRNNSTDSREFGPVVFDDITNIVLTWFKMPSFS